jgi:hypothetical protein
MFHLLIISIKSPSPDAAGKHPGSNTPASLSIQLLLCSIHILRQGNYRLCKSRTNTNNAPKASNNKKPSTAAHTPLRDLRTVRLQIESTRSIDIHTGQALTITLNKAPSGLMNKAIVIHNTAIPPERSPQFASRLARISFAVVFGIMENITKNTV